jgi:Toprim-like
MIDRAKLREVVRCNVDVLCKTLFPAGKRAGNEWQIGNTAGDPGDSLGICLVGPKAGFFHDRATGEGGDFVKLLELHFGFGYREAADWVERTLGIGLQCDEIHSASFAGERKKTASIRQPEPELPVLSADQLKRMAEAAHRLAKDPEQIFNVLGSRPEISLDAVRGAALDGDLGYETDCRFHDLSGPAILFGYSLGLKARWPADLLGKRHFRWIAGGARGQCWRQSLLRKDHRLVVVTEGETDVLSALSRGLEDEDASTLVIGLAGASILPKPEPFADRAIVLWLDQDEAGNRAAEKLSALFGPVAESVTICEGGLV